MSSCIGSGIASKLAYIPIGYKEEDLDSEVSNLCNSMDILLCGKERWVAARALCEVLTNLIVNVCKESTCPSEVIEYTNIFPKLQKLVIEMINDVRFVKKEPEKN